jgi:hypothetical protein
MLPSPLDVRIVGNISPPDWWTIGLTAIATILGAAIGAGIAFLIARQTASENRNAAAVARRESEEAATLRALVKVMKLVNSIAGYHMVNERTLAKIPKQHQQSLEIWITLLPQIGKPQEIHIEPDDLIAFTKSREFSFVTDLLGLCSQYNSMIYGVEAYGIRRDRLMERLTPEMMDRYFEGASWDDPKLRPLMPEIFAVRDLGDAIRAETKSLYEEALKVQPQFGPIVRKYFDDPHFPIPGIVPGAIPQTDSQQAMQTA